jgi:hypothetical protein
VAQVVTILTTPRSRSAWLANFLDYGTTLGMHEPSRFRDLVLTDLRSRLEDLPHDWAIIVDPSAASLCLEGWLQAFGDLPMGVIERPFKECWQATRRAIPGAKRDILEAQVKRMAQLGGPRLPSYGVTQEAPLRQFLARLAPGLPFQVGRFHQLRGMRVTVIPEIRY